MKQTYHPAREKVRAWIDEQIRSGHLRPGDRLPPSRALAAFCRVSRKTVVSVVKALKAEGIAAGGQRRVPWIFGVPRQRPATSPALVRAPEPIREKVRTALLDAIHSGVYKAGEPLPDFKSLRASLGASTPVVRAALEDLHRRRLLILRQRRYHVNTLAPVKPALKVVLIGFTYDPAAREAIPMGHHDNAVCGSLNAACMSRNLRMEIVKAPIPRCTDLRDGFNGRRFRPGDDIAGIVVLLNLPLPDLDALLSLVTSWNKPTAVIDVLGTPDVKRLLAAHGSIRTFDYCMGYEAARLAVRTLLQYGHRSFAYISPHRDVAWSIAREQGIRDELADSRQDTTLHPLTFDLIEKMREISSAAKPDTASSLDLFARRIRSALSDYPAFARRVLGQHFFVLHWWTELVDHTGLVAFARDLLPLANDRSITAWIAVNDAAADAALKFLNRRRVAVPEQLSLISFDDSSVALHQGITSCRFDIDSLVNAILNYLLLTREVSHGVQPARIEIPAILIHRRTTGPAPLVSVDRRERTLATPRSGRAAGR